MGYLTEKIDASTKFDPNNDLHSGFDRFSPENIAANKPVVDLVKRVAQQKNATPAQVALAWLLAQKPWIVPIPCTRNPAHLQENPQAVDLPLSPADLQGIDTAFAKLTVHGGRMTTCRWASSTTVRRKNPQPSSVASLPRTDACLCGIATLTEFVYHCSIPIPTPPHVFGGGEQRFTGGRR